MTETTWPYISIIIPTLNCEHFIGACLQALTRLDYPKEKLEFIVIDNGSRDRTLELAKSYTTQVQNHPGKTISFLRNTGAAQAKGEIFAFIDSDCVAPADWLKKAVSFLAPENVGAVGCWYALPKDSTFVERVWDSVTLPRREKIGAIDWVPSGDLLVKKDVYRQINGFNNDLTTSEDVDICKRIGATGKIVFSHLQLAVEHLGNPKTLKQFFLKERWRGEGVFQNFFSSFPRPHLSKALILASLTLMLLVAVSAGLLNGNKDIILFAVFGLGLLPFLMTIKILSGPNQQWKYFFPLWFLFLIYSIARAVSIFKRGVVWPKH